MCGTESKLLLLVEQPFFLRQKSLNPIFMGCFNLELYRFLKLLTLKPNAKYLFKTKFSIKTKTKKVHPNHALLALFSIISLCILPL